MTLVSIQEQELWAKFAAAALGGMLASAPLVDRMHVKEGAWADKASRFADKLLDEWRDRSQV